MERCESETAEGSDRALRRSACESGAYLGLSLGFHACRAGLYGLIFGVVFSATVTADSYTPGQAVNRDFKSFAEPFLEKYCLECHDDDVNKGNLSLENIGPIDEVNAAVWKAIWAQVALQEMPPKKKDQPPVIDRLLMSDWIVGQLRRGKGGFIDDLDPGKGNYVDHQLLFGPLPKGIELKPTSSPARIWRVTREEHVTRLNELINLEPKFEPRRPGLFAHGDAVPIDESGYLKLYFGYDNILHVEGRGPAVKAEPAIFATAKDHGLENYPHFYSVNSAEATQIESLADDLLRFMAYGVHSIAAPEQFSDITNKRAAVAEKKKAGTLGAPGTSAGIIYSRAIKRPLTPVYDLIKAPGVDEAQLRKAVDYVYEAVTFRPPSKSESNVYLSIVNDSIKRLGKEDGIFLGLSAIFLDRNALFRPELVASGTPDAHGRVMLQDWELGLAVNHALRFIKPDAKLKAAIEQGRMKTRADAKREIERMLADDSIRKPRVLQFFREYFDYDLAPGICKDDEEAAKAGVNVGTKFYRALVTSVSSTDRLVELILEKDQDVLKQLLTTNQVVVNPVNDRLLFARRLAPDEAPKPVKSLKRNLSGQNIAPAEFKGKKIAVRGMKGNGSNRILSTVPEGQRLGILTHPSWLISHSDAMDNHAVHRGKWVRERLIGGGIPDVPITVDAMLPDEPHNTLRTRMRVTSEKYCWSCHDKMDPLGLAFENFNHMGLYRTTEMGKPVDATGEIIESGDASLDGKVSNAFEMIRKLAASERAEQVFVRHAFRFWMGRNETLNDRQVLQDAHRAYKDSGGSMKALIASLVTSDAFLYRTRQPVADPI